MSLWRPLPGCCWLHLMSSKPLGTGHVMPQLHLLSLVVLAPNPIQQISHVYFSIARAVSDSIYSMCL